MKTKFIFYFLGLSLSVFSQQKIYTGTVVDGKTKRPIEGVLLIEKNEIIAYTNAKGQFDFKSQNSEETISFVHLSYQEKTVKLKSNLDKRGFQIALEEQVNSLDEVVIEGVKEKLTKKQLVKKAINLYEKHHRKEPYWAAINGKKIESEKFTLKQYIETDGVIWMPGEDKNPFNGPIIIPLKARIANFRGNDSVSNNEFYSFMSYRFFEQVHPLSKKGYRHFEYAIEKTGYLNNEACYIINYKERRPIKESTLDMDFMRGQIWISKSTFALRKLTTSFRLSQGSDNIYTINYVEKNKTVYPKKIYSSFTFVHFPKAGRVRGEFSFTNIYPTPTAHYIKTNRLYLPHYFYTSSVYQVYDQGYWSGKTFAGSRFESDFYKELKGGNLDSIFKKGAANKIYLNPNDLTEKRAKDEALILEFMKNDLKLK